MNQQKPSGAISTAYSNVSILFRTLRLLDCDQLDEWSSITAHNLITKDAGPNQKRRIENAEWILYQLFYRWDRSQTLDKLRPFFPSWEPIQSLNLRAALFRWLNQLKTDGTLSKDVMLRKTMFDDCKGERFLEMMAVFSTVVLRKCLLERQEGRGSVTRRLYTDTTATKLPQSCHMSLIIAHKAGIANSMAKRKGFRERYNGLSLALDMKDKEVERRFERVVETQDFLDQNIAPEATVARITKQFQDNWQADERYVKAVTQGDEITTHDAFLDRPFHEVWSDVSDGTYTPDFSLSQTGILEDLENRVAVQAVRLHEWKKYRLDLQKNTRSQPKMNSPVRNHDVLSPKDRASEKELVFSPRKSPRKSVLPVQQSPMSTPIKSSPSFVYRKDSPIEPFDSPKSSINDMRDFLKRRQSHVKPVLVGTPDTEHNDSGFSEISDNDLTTRFDLSVTKQNNAKPQDYRAKSKASQPTNSRLDSDGFAIPQPKLSFSVQADSTKSQSPAADLPSVNEEAQLADAILAATWNAAPTPSKPPLTLEERTRQSLALTSPSSRLATTNVNHAKHDRHPPTAKSSHIQPDVSSDSPPLPRLNLADRTRQSISVAALNKAKAQPRTSLAAGRRESARVFPVNQFETPGKGRRESGFDERAGYESVFKSRPKVGMSPRGTPVKELEGEEVEQAAGLGVTIESPLGRMGMV